MGRKIQYRREQVRLRFIGNGGRRVTPAQLLDWVLPALWDEGERAAVLDTAAKFARLLDENHIFFYPFALDLVRTAALFRSGVAVQHFPWDLPLTEIHPLCEFCRDWNLWAIPPPVPPFLIRGSAALFRCPHCGNTQVDDYAAGKAGMTYSLSEAQMRERFGAEGGVANNQVKE